MKRCPTWALLLCLPTLVSCELLGGIDDRQLATSAGGSAQAGAGGVGGGGGGGGLGGLGGTVGGTVGSGVVAGAGGVGGCQPTGGAGGDSGPHKRVFVSNQTYAGTLVGGADTSCQTLAYILPGGSG